MNSEKEGGGEKERERERERERWYTKRDVCIVRKKVGVRRERDGIQKGMCE